MKLSEIISIESDEDHIYVLDNSSTPVTRYVLPRDPHDALFVELLTIIYSAGYNQGILTTTSKVN